MNTQVTVTVEGGEYDSAYPTAEKEDGDKAEEISLKVRPNKKISVFWVTQPYLNILVSS